MIKKNHLKVTRKSAPTTNERTMISENKYFLQFTQEDVVYLWISWKINGFTTLCDQGNSGRWPGNQQIGRPAKTDQRDGPCFIIEFSWRLSAEQRITHVFYCSDNTEFNFTRSMVYKKRFLYWTKIYLKWIFPSHKSKNLIYSLEFLSYPKKIVKNQETWIYIVS